ncbi:sirohydrochlorin chelatase [Microlunatus flavus]|uniref:Sirohydrochlorin ferrochelatase n=1 Tax=Microlunatus flavus TaxID=1036181 RepID=A0A1H9LU43_9ACTN|nr:CbiX/SirB N-terminal domain-containing protein [Microlunatus flavus]SER14717.1 Sirohydrochlorin ferrochelatase [Microlunatus flavus]
MTFFHEPPATAGGSSASSSVAAADVVPVVGLAHGSRHPRGSDAIEALMIAVGAAAGVPAHAAYLDLAEPDLGAVAALLAEEGHERAVVVPLLFTQAFHARVDVPEAVAAASASSGLDLVVADVLGTGDDVGDVLRGALDGAGVDGDLDAVLLAVGSSRAEANEAVADLAARLSDGRRGRVRAAFGTCDPRVDQVLGDLGEPVALWPLFLADGLLLDPVRARFEERGWPVVEPLGAFAAPLVLARYAAALGR